MFLISAHSDNCLGYHGQKFTPMDYFSYEYLLDQYNNL